MDSLDNNTLLFPGPLSVPDEPFSFSELDTSLLNECPPDWMDHFYNYNTGDDEAPIFFLPETVHQPAPEPLQHRHRPRQPQYRPSELGPASGRRRATKQTSLDASLRQEPDCNDPFFLDRDFYAAEIAALLLRRNDTKRTARRRREKRPSPLSREVAKR